MSEGELQKRIRAMCPPEEEVFLPEKGEEIFGQPEVLTLIDEVKQEFPFNYFAEDGAIWKIDSSELEKWFKKWFGGEKV